MRSIQLQEFRHSVFFILATIVACPQLLPLPVRAANPVIQASPVVPQTLNAPSNELLFPEYPKLSMPALEASAFQTKPILAPLTTLKGSVTFTDSIPDPNQTIQRLIDIAVERDKEKELLAERAKFHNKKWTRLIGRSKGMLEYATSYQGFESSSEAADVILEEKLKLKSGAAVEYVRQKHKDAAHLQLTCAVMELATALGLSNGVKKEQAIQAGLQELVPLVGEEEASRCLQAMMVWSKQIKVSEDDFARDPWDVLALQQKSRAMLASSLCQDDVVKSIETRLHKFNRHSKFMGATSKFVNTTLSLIAFSPTMASPAAQAAQFVFVACTGGPEEKKLLKEVYLDRCFESRFERLSQESMLAVNNYNNAVLTRNPVLFSCTQALIEGMTNPAFGATLTSSTIASPDQTSSRKSFGQRI